MKKYSMIMLILFTLTQATKINAESFVVSSNTVINMQPGVALERTQQQILNKQVEMLASNLRALQLQIAEYRNRINQSASFGGSYTDMLAQIQQDKKAIKEINKKLGNNMLGIDKMAETMERRFGKDATILTTADSIKDQLKNQKDYMQRMYIRFAQIEKQLNSDFRNYNGENFAKKVMDADNPVKSMQLMADTMGGVQRSIHTLTEVMIEKIMKEQLDKMYALEQEKQMRAKQIAIKAGIEYSANKYKQKQIAFSNSYLTKEEKKLKDTIAKIEERDLKEEKQAIAIRLNETGLTQFNNKSTEENKTLTRDNVVTSPNVPRKPSNISDTVDQFYSDKLAIDLGKEHTIFDGNGNIINGEKNSLLTKFYDDGKSLLQQGIYSISLNGGSPSSASGFINDIINNVGSSIGNPDSFKKSMEDMLKGYARRSLNEVKNRANRFVRSKINEGKNIIRSKINETRNEIRREVDKRINAIVDAPRRQLQEIDSYLKSKGINVDLSKFGSGVVDSPKNISNDILNVLDNAYSGVADKAFDTFDGVIDDGVDNMNNVVDSAVDSILGN